MLRDSDDQAVRQANIVVKTGRKWKASGALKEAEERLQHADIMGTVTQGGWALESSPEQAGRRQGQRTGKGWCRRRFGLWRKRADKPGQ